MPANSTKRSFASDHVEGGYTTRNISLNTAEVGVQFAELAAEIIEDLTDGDADNRKAIRAASVVSQLASHLSHTHWLAADGNMSEAKKSAQNMAQKRRDKS